MSSDCLKLKNSSSPSPTQIPLERGRTSMLKLTASLFFTRKMNIIAQVHRQTRAVYHLLHVCNYPRKSQFFSLPIA
jgi:hypothetical protein